MGIKVALEHRTSYTFDRQVEPADHFVNRQQDAFGNFLARRGRRFEATGLTPGRVDTSNIREKQARQSTDVGAPGILDLRRMRTVLH